MATNDHLPFHQRLNQPPRSMKHHGKHRRPSPTAHSGAAQASSFSPGRAKGPNAIPFNLAFGPNDNTSTTTDPGAGAVTTLTWQDVTKAIDFIVGWPPAPKPPVVPYAGVTTGEIVGRRLWWVIEEDLAGGRYLCSLAHRRIWRPGEVVEGNVDEFVNLPAEIMGGTYAFRSPEDVEREERNARDEIEAVRRQNEEALRNGWFIFSPYWCGPNEAVGVATGTIEMWGEVVEHETGYRAQFAQLRSIDSATGCDLEKLRAYYRV